MKIEFCGCLKDDVNALITDFETKTSKQSNTNFLFDKDLFVRISKQKNQIIFYSKNKNTITYV